MRTYEINCEKENDTAFVWTNMAIFKVNKINNEEREN